MVMVIVMLNQFLVKSKVFGSWDLGTEIFQKIGERSDILFENYPKGPLIQKILLTFRFVPMALGIGVACSNRTCTDKAAMVSSFFPRLFLGVSA